jgi:hypothetical protein
MSLLRWAHYVFLGIWLLLALGLARAATRESR